MDTRRDLYAFTHTEYEKENKNSIIRINLGTLKTEGFPMDEFVSYDGKEECLSDKMFFNVERIVVYQMK